MPDETATTETTTTETQTTGAGAGGATTQATNTEPRKGDKNVIISGKAYGEVLQKERDKGKRAAQRELEEKAKGLGFNSVEAMFSHIGKRGAGGQNTNTQARSTNEQRTSETTESEDGTPEKPTPPSNRHDRKAMARFLREQERYKKQVADLTLKARQEERRRKDVQRQKDALEARMAIERLCIQKGVKDTDYVASLITRHAEGLSEEELSKGFDEAKYIDDLRGQKPYLFGETVISATTGTGGGNSTPPPKPGTVSTEVANNGKIDAMKMDRKQYAEHLKKRGINPDALS